MTRFRYRAESSPLGQMLRPIATVFVSYAGARVELPMYIDSGADISTIPFRFGKALGLRQTPTDVVRELSGISGGVVAYVIKRLDVQIGKLRLSARVAWALVKEVPLLLGRMDIFEQFRIVFDERRGFVDFNPLGTNRRKQRSRPAQGSLAHK